jgi:hypothetical protein
VHGTEGDRVHRSFAALLAVRRQGNGGGWDTEWTIYVRECETNPEESLHLRFQQWIGEQQARRARVALRGAAEAPCWLGRAVDLGFQMWLVRFVCSLYVVRM